MNPRREKFQTPEAILSPPRALKCCRSQLHFAPHCWSVNPRRFSSPRNWRRRPSSGKTCGKTAQSCTQDSKSPASESSIHGATDHGPSPPRQGWKHPNFPPQGSPRKSLSQTDCIEIMSKCTVSSATDTSVCADMQAVRWCSFFFLSALR